MPVTDTIDEVRLHVFIALRAGKEDEHNQKADLGALKYRVLRMKMVEDEYFAVFERLCGRY